MRYKTELNASMLRELNAKVKLIYKILLIVGIIGMVAYIVLGTILEEEVWWCEILLVFAIPFAIGLIMLLAITKMEKSTEGSFKYNEYLFEDEYFMVETFSNGENIRNAKIYYKDVVKLKETTNYIFLFIQMKQAYPIIKQDFTEAEKQKLLSKVIK